jgi:Na/Pi-cotransporter
MKIMTDSLKEIAGDRMRTLLEKLTSNRIAGVIIGALATAIIQSSSATTVMVIGFVNADVMTLNQAAAIIIGSNVGTTATGILASLESLNISLYLSMLVFVGVMLSFVKKIKKIANLLTGLGMIFVGLRLMSSACNEQSIKDEFAEILEKISFPLLLELLGVIFTAIIQSSSAMTGIVIVMVGKGVMTMDHGLFITLGANVGTCVTALLGIIGGNINAKRTAVIHLIFNIFGVVLFTPILWIFKDEILYVLDLIVSNPSMQIAYFHLCFNILTAIITTPLIDLLVIIAQKVVSDKKPDHVIDEAYHEKEQFAIRSAGASFSNLDDSTTSKNDKSLEELRAEINNNKYEPPIIIDNYIKSNDNKKNDDNEHDIYIDVYEEEEKKEKKEHLELIDVKEKNKNEIKEEEEKEEENIIENNKKGKKKDNKNIINIKEEKKDNEDKKEKDINNEEEKYEDNLKIDEEREDKKEKNIDDDEKEDEKKKNIDDEKEEEKEEKNIIKEEEEKIDKMDKEKKGNNKDDIFKDNKNENKDYEQVKVNMEQEERQNLENE